VAQDGKITALGPDAAIPAGAQVLDGRGLRVYPGLIDANTSTGLAEISSVEETVDGNEMGDLKPQLQAYGAIHPASEHISVTRVEGVTTVLTLPRGGTVSGQATLLNLDGWTVEEMVVRRSAGMVATIPSPNTAGGFNPATRTVTRRAFPDAVREAERRQAELAELLDQARHYHNARAARTSTPFDARLEAMGPVLTGALPVLALANSPRAIRSAVEFCKKQKLKVVIVGGSGAARVAGFLKEHEVPVIFGPVQSLPDRDDAPYDLPYATPGILAKAGVRFAISPGSTQFSRTLAFEAGTAAGNGLSEADALKAITLWPAQILGLDTQLGSLEVGKMANLVVTEGDVLEIRSRIRHVFIRGRPIPLESKHTRLWKQFLVR
ncbi:MAG: amidohydrolase family protein, partial [Armatimonadetes bacterium]|nr:amidohydrolase family protein [Armatimonadota bacterium]